MNRLDGLLQNVGDSLVYHWHGDTIHYCPRGSEIWYPVVVILSETDESLREDRQLASQVEAVNVEVHRDPAAIVNGQAVGGIQDPKLDDKMLREGDRTVWLLRGFVRSNSRTQTLRFERSTLQHLGIMNISGVR